MYTQDASELEVSILNKRALERAVARHTPSVVPGSNAWFGQVDFYYSCFIQHGKHYMNYILRWNNEELLALIVEYKNWKG